MRRLQENRSLYNRFTLAALGDSQTDLTAFYGVAPEAMWTSQAARRLNREAALVRARAFGVSGDTTGMMLARADALFNYDAPAVAAIYGGVNDPGFTDGGTAQAGTASTITLAAGASSKPGAYVGQVLTTTGGAGSGQARTIIDYDKSTKVATVDAAWGVNPNATTVYTIAATSQDQTQANLQAIVKAAKFRAIGQGAGMGCAVWRPSMLPANGEPGQRYVVMRDNSASGGVAQAPGADQHARIAGNYSAAPQQTVWEWRNPLAGEAGWARVAVAATAAFSDGLSRIMVLTPSYLNWAAGGDSFNTATGAGAQFAANVPVRAAATAAAAAEGVTLCDVYDFQSKLIYGGNFAGLVLVAETAQGSASFHYVDGNQHYSSYGHDTVARAVVQTIKSAGWLPALRG